MGIRRHRQSLWHRFRCCGIAVAALALGSCRCDGSQGSGAPELVAGRAGAAEGGTLGGAGASGAGLSAGSAAAAGSATAAGAGSLEASGGDTASAAGQAGTPTAGSGSSGGASPGMTGGSSGGTAVAGSSGNATTGGTGGRWTGGSGGSAAGTGGDYPGDWSECLYEGQPGLPSSQTEQLPTASQACSSAGALSCSASAPQEVLLCGADRVWATVMLCAEDEACDFQAGVCAPLLPECDGISWQQPFCDGDELVACSQEGTRTDRTVCCGACSAATCVAPSCGDGRVAGTLERCDDGNSVGGDGCENDCLPSEVMDLALGGGHSCARLRTGLVRCWGNNEYGQLGLGHSEPVADGAPYRNAVIDLGAPAVALAAGSDHSCALVDGGAVHCWGRNDSGQLGLGHTEPIGDDELPGAASSQVPLGAPALQIAAGGKMSCALLEDHSIRCWGSNEYGQLGLGHTETVGDDEAPSAALAEVPLSVDALQVSVGGEQACAILDGDRVTCWGRNDLGQLGLGRVGNVGDDEALSSDDYINFVVPMEGLVSARVHNCAVAVTGTTSTCWGFNGDGQLALGTTTDRPEATVRDRGMVMWTQIVRELSAGADFVCIRTQSAHMRCWGNNDYGQLGFPHLEYIGDSENMLSLPPIDLGLDSEENIALARMIAAGEQHACALLSTGEVACWGRNQEGQLGLGFVSTAPLDYVGGSVQSNPAAIPRVQVLPPN